MKKKMTVRARTEAVWGLAFIAPTIIGLLILNYYPIFETVWQSLCETGDFDIGNTFIGLENFKTMFRDKEVYSTLFNSFKYAVLSLPLTVAISLVLAVLLNRKMKFRSVYRTIFFRPKRKALRSICCRMHIMRSILRKVGTIARGRSRCI